MEQSAHAPTQTSSFHIIHLSCVCGALKRKRCKPASRQAGRQTSMFCDAGKFVVSPPPLIYLLLPLTLFLPHIAFLQVAYLCKT